MATPFDHLKAAMADRYTLEREIGAGGMATVFLAHDPRHNRKVAIKVMRSDLVDRVGPERFLKEIETTANLQHPHILPLFDSGRVDGTVFYVMPFVQGESLRARLRREKQLPIEEAVRLAAEIAAGLDYAHRQGVIHRDIKPDNVLLYDGKALVADFGIALAWADGDGVGRLTRGGVSLGTPQYMSPEQISGEHRLGPRSDVYALGTVLYEMLVGRPPFTGPTTQAVLSQVVADDPTPPIEERRTVPPQVDAAVMRALEKLPADRYQTAAEFAAALTGAGAGLAARRNPRASLLPWGIAAALAAVVAGLAMRERERPPAPLGTVRFTAELGPDITPTFTPIVRVSPDGRQLFVTAMVGRSEEVLHRPLDRDNVHVVVGAGLGDQGTGNSRPFVSPDGKWVAYARNGRLMKVPVDGGPAVDLATSDWGGGTWGRDGRLVYSRSYDTGLWTVSEGGGDERMLTAPDTATGELGHWWPQILPDGDHVVFTAYRTPIERATIDVVSMATGKRKVLLTGGVFGLYVPTRHLVYAVGETIRAVPFDLQRLAVTGTPLAVVDSVAMNPTDGAAAFGVSENGTLAYMPVSSYVIETQVVLVDSRGRETPALPRTDRYGHPRLSPDGGRVAVDVRAANSQGDVWVYGVGGSGGTRVTAEGGRDFGAEWSADGQELIYSSERPFFDLYRRASDASRPPRPLLTGGHDRYIGSVSRDGRLLAFMLSTSGGTEIWTVNLQGRADARRYLRNGFNVAHPAISPDGRWIAYDSDESGRVEVFAQSFPDPSVRRWKVSLAEGSEPLWTRDGRELVYRKGDTVMAVPVDPAKGTSGPPTPLFAGRYPDNPGWTRPRSYDVSADGERFLMLKVPAAPPPPRIAIVLNWFDELRVKVPR
ncbi:MAG TPA: protein kinase [Gemmatimonadales bacterium]|nr:protein kinase [Gemmatimonadales bacterium]